jgi:Cof subfamily protein (haloacid dehalogenase superfamily)
MADIKLVLADVDGTLVTKEKVLTERALRAVRDLRAANIGFAITSGRPPKGMAMLIEPLAIETPIAGFNGGVWVNPDLSEIEAHTLPRDVADETVKLILDAGLDCWVYSGTQWLVRNKQAPHVAREEWTVKFPPTVVADFGAALDNAVKIVGCSDDSALMEQTEKRMQDTLGDRASAARSQPYYLDITHPQANKGAAILWLSARLGIPAENILTLGDQSNDTLMFRKSGLSIAMGNASDAVKSMASKVTDSSEDEGFAKAIERFVLGKHHV